MIWGCPNCLYTDCRRSRPRRLWSSREILGFLRDLLRGDLVRRKIVDGKGCEWSLNLSYCARSKTQEFIIECIPSRSLPHSCIPSLFGHSFLNQSSSRTLQESRPGSGRLFRRGATAMCTAESPETRRRRETAPPKRLLESYVS